MLNVTLDSVDDIIKNKPVDGEIGYTLEVDLSIMRSCMTSTLIFL